MRVALPTKVFATCAGLATVVSLVVAVTMYRSASESLREEIRQTLKASASAIASQLDGSIHDRIRVQADEQSEEYRRLLESLRAAQDANPDIVNVYTMRRTDDPNVFRFVVDALPEEEGPAHVGEFFDASELPELSNGLLGPTADLKPNTDRWGVWLSGYAPIVNSDGSTNSIVGVDMSLEQLQARETSLRRLAFRSAVGAFILSSLLSLPIAVALLRTVRVFVNAADRVRHGDLDFQVMVRSRDEIGDLAKSFNTMVAGLRESRDRLLEATSRDILTGLYSHVYFQERLSAEIANAKSHDRPLAVLLVDVDRFKSVNERLGHQIGDGILAQLAELLKSSVRQTDIIGRFGGDKFALILPETDLNGAKNMAESLRSLVQAHQFRPVPLSLAFEDQATDSDAPAICLTTTTGIAVFPEHHKEREGLVMAADIALCRAKHNSPNTVSVYETPDSSETDLDPQQLYKMLRDPSAAAIRSLAAAVDAKDQYTHGHSERVTNYALEIGTQIGLSQDVMSSLRVAGLLHDLGKIGVPDVVLNKPGDLTHEERETVKEHPTVGANILRRAPHLENVVPAVLHHHERWDGSGYPDRLKGEEIPLVARLLAVADAFDAMTSDRPYRRRMSVHEALLQLQVNAGKQFDPSLVNAFIGVMTSIRKTAA